MLWKIARIQKRLSQATENNRSLSQLWPRGWMQVLDPVINRPSAKTR